MFPAQCRRAGAVTMRLADTRFQCRSTASGPDWVGTLSTTSIAARADFSAGSSSERCGNAGAKPAATSSTLRSRNGTASRSASVKHHVTRRRGTAVFHKLK